MRLRLAAEVVSGSDHLHSRLIIHQDIKPGNVLVYDDAQGRPSAQISDLGMAISVDPDTREAELRRWGCAPPAPPSRSTCCSGESSAAPYPPDVCRMPP